MKRTIILLLILSVAALGCDKVKELANEAKKVAQQTSESATGPDKDMVTKNQVTETYNELIGSIPDVLQGYTKKYPLGDDFVPPKSDSFNNPIHTLTFVENNMRDAKKAVEEAEKNAPDNLKELAAHARAMYTTAEATVKALQEIDRYFKAEDYKDDKYEKMKTLHKNLAEAAKAFQAASDTLGTTLSMEEDARDLAELKEHEKDKGMSYWFRFYLIHAKTLQKVTTATDLTPEALQKACDAFGPRYDEFKAWVDGQSGLHDTFKAYVDSAERFNITRKKLGRELKEAEVNPSKINSLLNMLTSNYNSLVTMRNTLSQLEARGLLK